jgi:hypothetical protein
VAKKGVDARDKRRHGDLGERVTSPVVEDRYGASTPAATALAFVFLRRLQVRYNFPDYLDITSRNEQTGTCRLWSLTLDQYLPSPRPSGGSLVIIGPGTGCQGQWLFWGRLSSSQSLIRAAGPFSSSQL